MKTVVEEQEIQSNAPAISNDQKSREVAVRSIHVAQTPKPVSADKQSKTDCYESCLDLSAQFLPRG